jgi:hypothetical protein
LSRVKLLLPFLVVLALVGAAGLSSLQHDDSCAGTEELSVTPPGWRCVDGPSVVEMGSLPWLLVALGAEAGVALWAVRRRESTPARLAATTTVALAAVGACGLIGGFNFAFTFGCAFGVPLAWLTDVAFARAEGGRRSRRRSLTAALVAGLAVFATAIISSIGVSAVATAIVVVAAVAATAAVPAMRPHPAR